MTITARIDAVTDIPTESRMDKPPCPRSVKVELTARCNFRCSFCATGYKLRDRRDMDRTLFEALALSLREAGVEEIGLFYLGESFLCGWLDDAVRFAKHVAKFPYVFLTTNGSLAEPSRVDALMAAGLDSLKFSFNYADAEQFKKIAQVKPVLYEQLKANVKAAHAVREAGGYPCGLYASYIAYDGEQGKRMKEAIAEVAPYLDEIYALPLYSQADLVGEAMGGMSIRAGNPGRLDAMRAPLPCWSLFTEAKVTWDGHLSACCFDHDGRFHMGDLKSTPFMEAWHSDQFQALRRAHLAGDVSDTSCEACAAYN